MSAARRSPRTLRWEWHRLDDRAAAQVVARAGVRAGDLVVDLGAGTGALTAALVAAGAHVIAVELHPARREALRVRFTDEPVTVVRADARDVALPRRAFRVVANPPWSVADTIRRHLLRSPQFVRADLVVPRWLARRWAESTPGARVGMSVRAESFSPPAPVGAAVAVITGPRQQR